MKDKKKKITVIIISIIIVLILLVAIAYAYFFTQLSGTDQIVKVGELELVLDETSEGINLGNAIGISDSEGMSLEGSTFELINNGNKAVDYTIYLDDNTISNTDTRIDDKYLKYNLNKNDNDSGATLLTRIGANPNRVIDSGTIEGKGTNKYKLNLWITDEVDGNYSGQVFSGKLRVEVSQERKTTSETLLANIPDENLYDDGTDTFITGENPNNYIWYSGKLWRAVSVNNEEKTVKLVTQWNISTIQYTFSNINFANSQMEEWLNDITVDGFLGNLRDYEKFLVMDAKWNASTMTDNSKPPSESDGGTIVEDSIGLLNRYEYVMSYRGTMDNSGYLNNELNWTLLTPHSNVTMLYIDENGAVRYAGGSYTNYGLRPAIILKKEVKIVSGNGTEDNPYRLEGDNDTNLFGTLLNTRYSGEYISFGTGENNLYRIVSHETEGLTKITSAEPLKENGTFKTLSFGDSVYYSSTNTIGGFLNGEYLNSGNYLTIKQVDMIEDNTTWFLGNLVSNTYSYKLAKYSNENMDNLTSNIVITKIGLLRYGELMSGQTENNESYFLITSKPNNSGQNLLLYINRLSVLQTTSSINEYGIKPSMNLKSSVIITAGTGTKSDPFQIELSSSLLSSFSLILCTFYLLIA